VKSNIRKIVAIGKSKSGKEYPIYEKIGESYKNAVSLTIPDQSIPLATLLSRYRRDGTTFLEGSYDNGDETIPSNFERLDKLQRIDFIRQNAERIRDTRSQLQKIETAAQTKKAKDAFDKAVAAEVNKVKLDSPSGQ